MNTRASNRSSVRLARKSTELGVAVPQVVTARLIRMAQAWPSPTKSDQREFYGMFAEKQLAFTQAMFAMSSEVLRLQMQFWMTFWTMPANPNLMSLTRRGTALTRQLADAQTRVFNAGIAPIHRKAVSNARRLNKTPLFVSAGTKRRRSANLH